MVEIFNEVRNSFNTEISVRGTPEEIEKFVEGYFINYHPYGYSTRIRSDVTEDNIRTVKISRWNSCD